MSKKKKSKERKRRLDHELGFILGYNTARIDELMGERAWNDWKGELSRWQKGFLYGAAVRQSETRDRNARAAKSLAASGSEAVSSEDTMSVS